MLSDAVSSPPRLVSASHTGRRGGALRASQMEEPPVLVIITPAALARGVASAIGARLQRRFQLVGMRQLQLHATDADALGGAAVWAANRLDEPCLATAWDPGCGGLASFKTFLGTTEQPLVGSLRFEFGVDAVVGPIQGKLVKRCVAAPTPAVVATPAPKQKGGAKTETPQAAPKAAPAAAKAAPAPGSAAPAAPTKVAPAAPAKPPAAPAAKKPPGPPLVELSISRTGGGVDLQIARCSAAQPRVVLAIEAAGKSGCSLSVAPLTAAAGAKSGAARGAKSGGAAAAAPAAAAGGNSAAAVEARRGLTSTSA